MSAAWGRAGLVAAIVLACDQATKALVVSSLARGDRRDVFVGVDLVHVRNRGIAFGLFDGWSGPAVTIVIAVALVALLLYFALHANRPFVWLPTGLLLGGALGNLIDRTREGAVIDFVDLPLWPAFNVADVSITAGVVALVLSLEAARDGTPSPA